MSLLQLYMGIPMFIISCIEDDRFGFTRYFKPVHYGASLLDLQYTCSIFAILFGILGILAVHHWASLVSNKELFLKLSRGLQFILLFQLGFGLWCISVLFTLFQNTEWDAEDSEYYMEEIKTYYYCSVAFQLPHLIACLMYGLNINFLEERATEGEDVEEPLPLPDHAMDLQGVTVTYIVGLALLIPMLLASQIWDFFVETVQHQLCSEDILQDYQNPFSIPFSSHTFSLHQSYLK